MNKQKGELLNFLKKENQMLKDDIKQMREILRLNKQALQVSLNYKSEQNYEKSIPQLINLLYEQNNHLRARILQLQNEIEAGLCKALISDQIAFASTQHEVLLTSELKDKLIKMKRELQSKQKRIIELTRLTIDEKTGLAQYSSNQSIDMLRIVEYSDMNKVTKKLKDQIEKLSQQLDQKKQQLQKMKDGKQQLFKLNLILTKQLNELKLLTSCQTTKSNNNNEMSIEMSSNDMTRYIKYQKKLVNQEENIYEDQSVRSSQNSDHSSSNVDDSMSSQMGEINTDEEDDYNQNEKQQDQDIISSNHQNEHDSEQEYSEKTENKANQSMNIPTMKFSSTLNQKSFAAFGQKHKINMTLNLNNLSLKKNLQSQSKLQQNKPKFNIPKLQLSKAKQIQNLIVKKINNDQKKKKQSTNPPIKQERYKKLEQELQNLRKKMGNQILQKHTIERQCNFFKKIIAQLQQRNTLLVEKRVKLQQQQKYEKKRRNDFDDNMETLLDICRDVTMNQRLRRVVLGKQELLKKDVECLEI